MIYEYNGQEYTIRYKKSGNIFEEIWLEPDGDGDIIELDDLPAKAKSRVIELVEEDIIDNSASQADYEYERWREENLN